MKEGTQIVKKHRQSKTAFLLCLRRTSQLTLHPTHFELSVRF